jgi:hypothetical protein
MVVLQICFTRVVHTICSSRNAVFLGLHTRTQPSTWVNKTTFIQSVHSLPRPDIPSHMVTDMNPVEHLWNYLGRKLNARTPKYQYFRNWGLFWCRNSKSSLKTDWDALLREEETCSGTVQDTRQLDSLLTASWVINVEKWTFAIPAPKQSPVPEVLILWGTCVQFSS